LRNTKLLKLQINANQLENLLLPPFREIQLYPKMVKHSSYIVVKNLTSINKNEKKRAHLTSGWLCISLFPYENRGSWMKC